MAVALLISGCKTPEITRLTITNPAGGPIRMGDAVDVATEINTHGANTQMPGLTLSRLNGTPLEQSYPLTAQTPSGDINPYTATIAPTNSNIPLEQGSWWRALVSVRYVYGWSYELKAKSVDFLVTEPGYTFGFIDSTPPGSAGPGGTGGAEDRSAFEGWNISSYHKFLPGQVPETSLTSRPTLAKFPAQNYPNLRPGDNAIGFTLDLQLNSSWDINRDLWSAILSSPNISGASRFRAQIRSNAGNSISVLSYVNVTDSSGASSVVVLKASKDNQYWSNEVSVAGDDTWHTVYFETAGTALTAGAIHAIHLEIFGPSSMVSNNQSKYFLIDQITWQP